ncbi:MAG: arylesterase, partial [Desulfuromonadaceae bacterium]
VPEPRTEAADEPPSWRIVALGDSLTAGYGLSSKQAFPPQLEKALKARGIMAEVINAGVSGDTTADGLARLEGALAEQPDLVIVEFGANDALRGLPPEAAAANLDTILSRLQEKNIQALLTGMVAPRNFGPEYYNNFNAIYPRLAERYGIPLYPFFLEGVAGDPALNRRDGLHPTAAGVKVIVQRILPLLLETLGRMQEKRSATNRKKQP